MNKLLLSLTVLLQSLTFYPSLSSDIISTNEIQDIKPAIKSPKTLVLFNIAEVLTDTPTSLGSSPWRKYIRKKVTSQQHDKLTLHVFKFIPHKAVDDKTPTLIRELQENDYPVMAFTSRGRHEWYASQISDIDLLTEDVLMRMAIDFPQSTLPDSFQTLSSSFAAYYHNGIFYAGNSIEKGTFLAMILKETGYRPDLIIFIDDKEDSLQTVDKAMQSLGIPFLGVAYHKTTQDHVDFDPMIANIQLDWLIFKNVILTDVQAAKIKSEQFSGVDPEAYFSDLINRIDFSKL